MKKTLLPFLFLLMSISVSAQYEKYGGVYYAYPVKKVEKLTVPKGFVPFYISHYGRHGSRWMSRDSRYEWIEKQFEDESNLTAKGLEVKRRLQPAFDNARGNGGKLTPLDAKQHRQIAQRMFNRFKVIFKGKDLKLSARSSTSPRCAASMHAFCDELRRLNKHLDITEETHERYMRYIAYTSPEEDVLEHQTVVECKETGERLAKELYKDPSLMKEHDKLLSELHTLASDMQDIPLPYNYWDLFTEAEIKAIYDKNNTRMRIVNGIDPSNHDIPARCGASLWRNIVETADSVIATHTNTATLRFGHDTCLYHLFSLLGLFDGVPNLMDEMLPMAANLQFVFYHNEAGEIIVQLLHNEKPIALPASVVPYNNGNSKGLTGENMFYRWEDIKSHYQHWLDEDTALEHLNNVNTFTGTAPSATKTAGLFGKKTEEFGQTLPAVLSPNGMNFWTPQTRWTEKKCVAPYYYNDKTFQGFRNSHWLVGGCTQDYGSFTLTATLKGLSSTSDERPDFTSTLDHEQELSHPYYYRLFADGLLHEMTASSRAAIFRFTRFSANGSQRRHSTLADGDSERQQRDTITLVVTPNSDERQSSITIDRDRRCLYATNPVHRIYQGWGEEAGFAGHYVLIWKDELVDARLTDSMAVLTFAVDKGHSLIVKAASSFCDEAGAVGNLETEIPHWDFMRTYCQLQNQWISQFQLLTAQTDSACNDDYSTAADTKNTGISALNKFYGAFYRASFLPHEFDDADGRYPMFANGNVVTPYTDQASTIGKEHHYMDFSMWDTYRAVHPLLNIIAPQKSLHMVRSLVDMAEQGGWMPIFPCWNSYTAAMIGDHVASVIADAWVKGIRGFDLQKAYKYLRQNAFEQPATEEEYKNGMGRRALKSYLDYGYIPLEEEVKEAFHTNEQTSRTLEYAYDDFCVAQLAKALNRTDDYQVLMTRSEYWRNVINPQTGYADGRHTDGTFAFASPIEKVTDGPTFITEGAPCHYTWYVPQNPNGLMAVMGGRDAYLAKLDSMFTEGRYWHGNEPCHQVAYMFNYAAAPWLTQKNVRHIIDTEYLDGAGGLSGNDDAGQMSSWLLFSMMGFYPVCPGTPYYMIGSPVFPRLDIRMAEGRTFTIEAENASPENIYIQSATLNGQPYNRNYLHHNQLQRGGTLHFVMGPKPNKEWGKDSLPSGE